MRIECSICKVQFGSVVIDPKDAVGEVSNKFIKHLAAKHPAELAAVQGKLNALMQLQAWVLSMDLVTVLLRRKEFDELYEKQINQILELLGIEDEGEEAKNETVTPSPKPFIVKP